MTTPEDRARQVISHAKRNLTKIEINYLAYNSLVKREIELVSKILAKIGFFLWAIVALKYLLIWLWSIL